ncbi:MAG: type I DNA topoisomerase [Sulfuricurvum sp.]|jgi:DNA topoisomerase-1|uniref:type I DNA topoisomerase n=1 Tax=Sulfuricurvum sp. TaxID=2025608 RepID=UPI0025F980FE|nr:type I DNA topoisomerase [Sulfuricurvum sp.]MCK9373618.1 type I DNA topoisomerase [Sulfuricurvum sp.]
MSVIIVESPNKIKKIREITGSKVYATVGHFADMPKNSMGLDMETYEPEFIINPEKQDNVDKIIAACEGETVYIASDADREGYAIGMLLYQRIKDAADQCWRLEIREITEKGIAEAMNTAVRWEETNYKFYDSFLGRRVADRLAGYILSPLASSSLKGKFSVGRVQSPAVRLVVDREREIRNFKPTPYFTISTKLSHESKTFTAQFSGYLDDTKSFKTKEEAEAAISDASLTKYATVESVEKKVVNRGPKAPFTTVDMQAAASISLSIAPEKSMQLAQGLFEAGLITYHRTDSVRLSDEFLAEAAEFVRSNFGGEHIPEKPKKHSSNSQAEAHEAIRPTHLHPLDEIDSKIKTADLTADHAKLYRLIFKRAVASMMSDATADATSYQFDIGGLPFKASGSVPKFPGWTALYIEESEDEKEAEQSLPDLAQGDLCDKQSIDVESKMTKAPGRFTEASLVKQLEKMEIGRPSTYASIIGRIKSAGYVSIEKKKLVANSTGEQLIDFLNNDGHSWIIDYTTTANMEEYLDKVADEIDGATWQAFAKSTHEKMGFFIPIAREARENKAPSEKQIAMAQSIAEKKRIRLPDSALESGFEMSKWLEKNMNKPTEPVGKCKCGGDVKEWDKNFQCSGCKATIWKEFLGKKITKTQAINLLAGKTITLSGLKSKAGKEFDAKAKLDGGKIELEFGKK